jgi:hypothetical protein
VPIDCGISRKDESTDARDMGRLNATRTALSAGLDSIA